MSRSFLSGKKPSFDVSDIASAADRTLQELSSYDVSKVVGNMDGEVGKRGELYVLAQGVLIVCIVLGGVPVVGEPIQAVLGPLLLLSGLLVGVLSVVDLGSDSLSPFPKPSSSGSLKTTGVYGQMRHPMYTALMTVMLGLSMISNSADRLLLTGLLYYLLEVKSDKEEAFLAEQYGSDYAAYQVCTKPVVRK
jgi:protein-S-isoprenylcysteine O-methyltransferase Ste14